MRMRARTGALLAALLILGGTAAASFGNPETIRVLRNGFTFTVNGQEVQADNFLFEDRAYVRLADAAAAMGMTVTWDPATRTAAAVPRRASIRLTAPVDPFAPVIDLASLGVRASDVEAVGLEGAGETFLSRRFTLAWDQLIIADEEAVASGRPVLALNAQYTLKLFTRSGGMLRAEFTTAGLPELTASGERRFVMVPAMPERGFHWPYFLVLPSDAHREANAGHRRYLVVDINNTGPGGSVPETIARTRAEVALGEQVSMKLAEELWSPLLIPAIPRPVITYRYGGEENTLFTHALDRDAATLHLKMQDPELARLLERQFSQAGYTVESLAHLDRQVVAMIEHAVGYLNRYGQGVEEQVFLVGFSASGTFTDRLAALHPERVKALVSGATLDNMLLPLSEYGGEKLIYPIGTADYAEIAGRPFDLAAHNRVARLIYMGEDDPNNTVLYRDSYGGEERRIITKLWGEAVLPRAEALTKLYGEAGGHGIFILDRGVGHDYSEAMYRYMKAFLEANRDGDEPVYPLPADAEQLRFTVYR
ncbi:pimeloyl-ACP methyl ester carboxylesterase [Symbiobacterium terraclitae]|uniref:Pimeloyl-ACP methyl ester carboxylesterase n=1 Tax=Symbiobacterium terraclitae TaxID=557451 RepID=A0ABS4JW90_9FIRM|nr:hypothetical protein [Symbiobacterium terraclitae]MBP2019814.1 pimeloyl-ACP methyl ester carboxylesterase [Symbiobacterium terraclitae]